MSTKRTTITIPESLYQLAQRMMAARHFSDFAGYVQHLIREEAERRQFIEPDELQRLRKDLLEVISPAERADLRQRIGVLEAAEAASAAAPTGNPAAQPVSYLAKPRKPAKKGDTNIYKKTVPS